MVGRTERGPEYPRLITSWLEFQRWYGSYLPIEQSFFPYAVQGFFDNGGQRLFVARAMEANATFASIDVEAGVLRAQAVGRGTWGNRVYLRVSEGSKRTAANQYFRLDVIYYREGQMPNGPVPLAGFIDPLDPTQLQNPARIEPDRVESYDNLVHTQGASNNIMSVVNSASQLIRVWFLGPPAPITVQPRPAPNAPAPATLSLLTNGTDGNAISVNDYVGSPDEPNASPAEGGELLYGRGHGLEALATIDEIALLAIPDEVLAANPNPPGLIAEDLFPLTQRVINQSELLKDSLRSSHKPWQDRSECDRSPTDTTYAAFYYPWIEIYDPVSRSPIWRPPGTCLASSPGQTSNECVFKAPANEVVRDATNLEFAVTKDAGHPQSQRVNCIRDFRSDGRGIRLWGARTMSSDAM
jgi:hypothetical protein